MNKEEIDKWLNEEYGCSYTRLEELHDFYFEKYIDLREENKQLKIQISAREEVAKKYKEVIDKAIEYINDNLIISSILDGKKYYTINNYSFDYRELLDILKEVE